jgi:hypothetical protein
MYYRLCRNEDKDNVDEEEITEKRSGDGRHGVLVFLKGTTGMHIYAIVQVYGGWHLEISMQHHHGPYREGFS